MKRHMKMSVVLVTLLLTLGILLTGCNTEELQAQIDDVAAKTDKADGSIKDVAADVEAAEKALADAVKDLKDLIAKGDKTDADALAAAIATVNSAIDAAKKAAADGDAALQTAIDAAEAAIEAVKAAADKEWNSATDAAVAALEEFYVLEWDFFDNYENYAEDKANAIEKALDLAWVKVLRALDDDAVKAAMDELKATLAANPTITGEIYALLNEIVKDGVNCAPAEKDDATNLAKAKALIDGVKAGTNDELKAELNAYGADDIDLEAKYNEYKALYDAAVAKLNGEAIKAEMDKLNEGLMTFETDITAFNATYLKFRAWEDAAGNDHTKIDGFVATLEAFVANMERVADLKVAKTEAEALNARIEAFAKSVADYASTKANFDAKKALTADVQAWIEVYFSGDYAAEKDPASVNYKLLNVDAFNAACKAFDDAMGGAMAAAMDFIIAVKNVGDINLLSWDEIELAQKFYVEWMNAEGVNDFGFMFNEDETPEDYFATLANYVTTFDNLKAKAYADYVAAKATADTVDATTINLYSTELNALIKWYADYTFVNGVATFENTTFAGVVGFSEDALKAFGEVADGYKLDTDLVITAETYKALTDLKAVQDKLIADKNAETEALIKQIGEIGFVSIARTEADSTKGAVDAARTAYTTWKNGTSAQNAVADGCTVFVVTNYDVLVAAEAKIVSLEDQFNAISALIADLEYTNAGMDLADLPATFDAVAYAAEVKNVKDLYAAFIDATNGNNGNRGMITDDELAKLAAADLIVTKYNALVEVKEIYDAKVATVTDAAVKADLATAYNMSKGLIELATDVDTINTIVDRAEIEFDAVINGEILD